MIMNAYGRTFGRGKSIEKDIRSLIIDEILSEDGDAIDRFFPGCKQFSDFGNKRFQKACAHLARTDQSEITFSPRIFAPTRMQITGRTGLSRL